MEAYLEWRDLVTDHFVGGVIQEIWEVMEDNKVDMRVWDGLHRHGIDAGLEFYRRANLPPMHLLDGFQKIYIKNLQTLIKLSVLKGDASKSLTKPEAADCENLYTAIFGVYKDVVSTSDYAKQIQIAHSPILTEVAHLPTTPFSIKSCLLELANAHL